METEIFIGCDIAQDSFTYCVRSKTSIHSEGLVANEAKAIKKWINSLGKVYGVKMQDTLFTMEHTGIYNAILLRELSSRSLRVCVENPMNIKFSLGMQRGKNDKVDAQRIAEYAMRNTDRLQLWQPKREVLNRLQLLIGLRERSIKAKMILSRFNQDAKRFFSKQDSQMVIEGSKDSLAALERDIERTDAKIEKLIMSDANLKRLATLVMSVDGIGMVTCSAVLVKTNEFKDFTEAKKFACTAGIAPFEHTSGSSIKGKTRVNHRAHKDLKKLFHMCALGAISRNGELKDYYLRKVGQGKNKMLVLNAVRNKLVSRIFAVVRNNVMYQKDYKYHLQMS